MSTSSTPTPDADRLLLDTLHRVWGFAAFRPLQREAMHAVLASRDSVVVLPTGGGKSLCFQAPALVDPSPPEGGHYVREGLSRTSDEGLSRTTDVVSGFSRTGVALVVSPLISLMKDQVDGLRVDGVAAAY